MTHQLLAEVMSTALMIIFGVGVHCDDVLKKTKFWILEQVPAEPKIFVSAPVSSGGIRSREIRGKQSPASSRETAPSSVAPTY